MSQKIFYLTLFFLLLFSPVYILNAQNISEKISGQILLQIERNGEAWYVNPKTNKRHYMGRPVDAFALMKNQGIGVSNENLRRIPVALKNLSGKDSDQDGLPDLLEDSLNMNKNKKDSNSNGINDYKELKNKNSKKAELNKKFIQKQKGKILLQVRGYGEAWYINPKDGKKYFLGRPADAFKIMRGLGVGATNNTLSQITKNKEFIFEKIDPMINTRDKKIINGEAAYIKKVDNGKKYIVIHGDYKSRKYDDVIAHKRGIIHYYGIHPGTHRETEKFFEIDGKLTYKAKIGDKEFVVHGGKEGEKFNEIWDTSEINGKLFYIAEKDKNITIVYDGKSKEYDKARNLYIKDDIVKTLNDQIVYLAVRDDKFFVVKDYQEGKKYEKIEKQSLETKNNKVFFEAGKNCEGNIVEGSCEKRFYVYGGKEFGKKYDFVSRFGRVLPNGLAYTANDGGKEFVVHNQKEGKKYDSIRSEAKFINNKLTYAAEQNGKVFIVQGGEEKNKKYNDIYLLDFDEELVYLAEDDGEKFLVKNGQEGKKYHDIDYFSLEKINNKITYKAIEQNPTWKELVVYGDSEGKKYDSIKYVFKEIGGDLVYVAEEGNSEFIVKNNSEEGKKHDSILTYSEFNNNLLYEVKTGNKYKVSKEDKYYFIYKGKKSKGYDELGEKFMLGENFCFWGKRNDRWFLVKNNQETREHYRIKDYTIINDKLAYIAKEANVWYVLYDGEKVFWQKKPIYNIKEDQDKLSFHLKKEDGSYVAREK